MLILCLFRLLLVASVFICSCCYNLDEDHIIIYENPSKGTGSRGSYFGFSLLLYSDKQNSWVQIGAPRGNDTKLYPRVKEPGVVFRCPIKGQCRSVTLDNVASGSDSTTVINNVTYEYVDKKEGAWIGGAMDINVEDGSVVVCGHRWRNRIIEDLFDYMIGVCYWSNVKQNITEATGVSKLLPLGVRGKHFETIKKTKYIHYGLGQAGISVHFPKYKENPEILIGAPGVANWKGSTVSFKVRDRNDVKYDTLETKYVAQIEGFALFGYEVNSGKFNNLDKFYYISGNPKGAKNKGRVFVYTYKNVYEVNILKYLDGYQTGEYFGSSVAVADINCDGVDDLIVGAPQYTANHDEGRIYLFVSNLQKTVFNSPVIKEGKSLGGRFGTSVTALGDLDGDGCDDIAVGAPYENNNTGAVYIYNGDPKDLLTLTQSIHASEIHSELKGFGISISRAADIDDNKYPDVAVGAFLSDKVVLLRAQPVVILKTTVTAKVKELKRNAQRFQIEVCLEYSGNHVPNTLTVFRRIFLDERNSRAHFSSRKNSMESKVDINNYKVCETLQVFLLKAPVEESSFDPITIKVIQEPVNISENKTVVVIGKSPGNLSHDGFNKKSVVVNIRNSTLIALHSVPFETECGNKDKCEADLHLNCSFSGVSDKGYIIGSNSELKLEVSLMNLAQPAYMAVVVISIPSPILLSSGHKNCREVRAPNGSLLLHCQFGNPLRNGTSVPLTLKLDTSAVKAGSNNLTFYATATTTSVNKNIHSSQQLLLNFVYDAVVKITGRSEKRVYSYSKMNRTHFRHRYEIQKTGYSPVEVVEVQLDVPIRFNGIYNDATFVNLSSPEAYLNAEQPLSCQATENYEYYYVQENTQGLETVEVTSNRRKREVMTEDTLELSHRRKRETMMEELQLNQTLYLNCSMPQIKCLKIKCYAGPFNSGNQTSASVELKMVLNISNIGSILDNKNTIYLSTNGSVSIKQPEVIQISERRHYSIINTTFNTTYFEVPAKKVSTWIVALSIIAGILIFMFVTIGLMKAGFFERKKKEELKSLMAIYANNVFTAGPFPKAEDNKVLNDESKEDENNENHNKSNEDDSEGEEL